MLLTNEQLELITKLKKEDPKASWAKIKDKLVYKMPEFNNLSPEEIKEKFRSCYTQTVQEPLDFWVSDDKPYLLNPNNYFYNHKGPGQLIKYGVWSKEEENMFIKLVTNSIKDGSLSEYGQCGIFSIKGPFRVGYQCAFKYSELLSKGLVPILPERQYNYDPAPVYKYAFSKDQEKIIALEIQKRIERNEGVTIRDCQKLLHDCYYDPHLMAKRAAELIAVREGIQMYDNDGFKTDEFLNLYQRTFEIANKEPQILFEEAHLPRFVASRWFVECFMKRNNFSLRKPHISRRGSIKADEVDRYITKLKEAIEQFGEDHVFNMDETSVRIAYYPNKVVGIVGSDAVHVDTRLNLKENFTAIMTCTRNKKYPPIILAKGKTDKCTNKFNIEESTIEHFVWRSDYGWTDEDVMKRYLSYLHGIHPEPCALVLDSFRAHITGSILKLASELNITVIQVPSNGTGTYQPLDRRIFGIVKAKLRKELERRNNNNLEKRWSVALKCLLDAWSSITDNALASAWSIPGLQEGNPFVPRDDEEFQLQDEAEE